MIISLILLAIISLGGIAASYLIAANRTMLWRFAAGCVIGSAVYGTLLMLLGSIFGLNAYSSAAAVVLSLSPAALFWNKKIGKAFHTDRNNAKGKLYGLGTHRYWSLAYYVFFFLLFVFFFDRAMMVSEQGIFTGGSNNLGDLPHHIGAITAFVEGNAFPPENPSFSGTKFSYPFVADLVTAGFASLGIGIKEAMHAQNLLWAFSLLVIFEGFVFSLLKNKFAARLAPAILFFSGGLGFLWFFSDAAAHAKGFSDYLFNLPKDYTIGDEFRWGNSLITLFLTQRGILLGMPVTLLVLGVLWDIFSSKKENENNDTELLTIFPGISTQCLSAGVLAGMLPLIHLHSLAVLFIVSAFLFFLRLDKIKYWLTFGAAVFIIAVPELIWSMSGSASRASEFIGWHFGWDSRDQGFVWFWLKNSGLAIPFLLLGIVLLMNGRQDESEDVSADEKGSGKNAKKVKKEIKAKPEIDIPALLKFYLPFLFIFIACNSLKLAPWEWDNIKLLIYWFLLSIPLIAYAVSRLYEADVTGKLFAAAAVIVLTASGALDVWRTAGGQVNFRVFNNEAVEIAEKIKNSTPRDSLFANATTYNSAVVLTGRRSLMRYGGHLFSHGIDYKQREEDIKAIYRGGQRAEELISRYGVDYVLISPEERGSMQPNDKFFEQYPLIAEAGQYRVYRVNGK